MSQTIDTKVVEMKFQNSDFEKNAKQSMSTLDELKEKLKMSESAESFKNISKAAKDISFEGLNSGIETVKTKFSALEEIATGALRRIGERAADAGMKLVNELALESVTQGWAQYENKTKSVSTIMNATGLGIDEVNSSLEKLIWYADETSYSFDDMTNNIGKFTSMGVGLDDSVSAMMGISNWAAVSGQGINEAGRAMYNLSQAMGMGYVGLNDWKSVQNANMATKEFKEQVIATAEAMGTIEKGQVTLSNFESDLTKGKWFTSDVLLSVLKQYSEYMDLVYDRIQETGEATSDAMAEISKLGEGFSEVSERAGKAAQEAKTFGDAMEATKDAVKSQWAELFEGIFGNYEEQKVTWTKLSNTLWDVFAGPVSDVKDAIKEAMDPDTIDRDRWHDVFNEVSSDLGLTKNEFEVFEDVIKDVAKEHGIAVDKIVKDYDNNFDESLVEGWLNTDILQEAVDKLRNGDFSKRIPTLAEILDDKEFFDIDWDKYSDKAWYTEGGGPFNINGPIGEAHRNIEEGIDSEISLIDYLQGEYKLTYEDALELTTKLNAAMQTGATETGQAVEGFMDIVQRTINGEFGTIDDGRIERLTELGWDFNEVQAAVDKTLRGEEVTFNDLSDATLVNMGYTEEEIEVLRKLADYAGESGSTLNDLYSYMSGADLRNETLDNFMEALGTYFETFREVLGEVFGTLDSGQVRSALERLHAFSQRLLEPERVEKFRNALHKVFSVINTILTVVKGVWGIVSAIAGSTIIPVIKGVAEIIGSIANGIGSLFETLDSGTGIADWFKSTAEWFSDKLSGVKNAIEAVTHAIAEFITRLFNGQSVFGAIRDTGENLINALIPDKLLASEKVQAFQRFLAKIKSLGKTISETFKNVGKTISDAFKIFQNTELGQSISNFVEKIKTTLSDAWTSIKNWFKNLFKDENGDEPDVDFLTSFKNTLDDFNDWLENLDLETHLNNISNAVMNFKYKIEHAFGKIKDFFTKNETLSTTITTIKEKFGELKETLKDDKSQTSNEPEEPFIVRVLDKIKIALEWFKNNLPSFDQITNVLKNLLGSGLLVTLFTLVRQIKQAFSGSAGVMIKITKVLNGVGNALNAFAFKELGKGVLFMAAAIAAIAISLAILANVDAGKLQSAAIALGVVAAGFGVLAVGIGKLMQAIGAKKGDQAEAKKGELMDGIKNGLSGIMSSVSGFIDNIGGAMATSIKMGAYAKLIIALAAAIAVLSVAVFALSKIPFEGLIQGLGTVLLLIGALAGAVKLMTAGTSSSFSLTKDGLTSTKSGMGSSAFGALAVAAAVLVLVQVIKQVCDYPLEDLLKGVGTIGAILLELAVFTRISKDMKVSTGIALLAVGASMLLFVKSMDKLRSFNLEDILKGVITLGSIMIALSFVMSAGGNFKLSSGLAVVAIAGSMLIFVNVLKKLSEIRADKMLSGLVGLAGILATLAGFIWVLDKIASHTENLSHLLFSIAAIIAAVAAAVWVLSNAINQGIDLDQIGIQLGKLATGLVQGFVDTITNSAESIVQGVLTLLATVATYAPQFVDVLVNIVTNVLDSLTTRMPELATSIANFCKALIDNFAIAFQGVDLSPLVSVINELLLVTGALTLIGRFGSVGTILSGIAQFGLVVAALMGLIAAFGGINDLITSLTGDSGSFADFINRTIEPLKTFGVAIGEFFGGIAGGFMDAFITEFSSSLPTLGTNLSSFMTNVQPFLDGCSAIDGTFLDGVGNLVLALGMISAGEFVDSFLNGVGRLLGISQGSDSYMAKFTSLGEALVSFANTVGDVDFSKVEGASNAALVLTALINAVPGEGGVLQWLLGTKDFDNADQDFANLGNGVKAFCEAIQGVTLDDSTVTNVGIAAGVISTLLNTLPPEDGLWQKITGQVDLENSDTKLEALGKGVKAFCTAIDGVTLTDETASAARVAADIIATLINIMPNEGGKWQEIVGKKDFGNVSDNFYNLGHGVARFAKAIENVTLSEETKTAAESAALIIETLSDITPNTGGIWQDITGEKNFANMGFQMRCLGEGIANFSAAVSDIDITAAAKAYIAGKAILTLMNLDWPKEGGLVQTVENIIGGSTDWNSLSEDMKTLGEAISGFCTAVTGTDLETIQNAKSSAEAIIELMKLEWPETDQGILGAIGNWVAGGNTNWNTLKSQMISMGQALKGFSDEVVGITEEGVTGARSAGDLLIALVNAVPEDRAKITNMGLFSTNVTDFGTALGDFSASIAGTDFTQVTVAAMAIRALIAVLKDTADVNFENAAAFPETLDSLGEAGVTQFTDNFNNADQVIIASVSKFIGDYDRSIRSKFSQLVNLGKESMRQLNVGMNEGERLITYDALTTSISKSLQAYDKFVASGNYDIAAYCVGLLTLTGNDGSHVAISAANAIVTNTTNALEAATSYQTAGSNSISSYQNGLASGGINLGYTASNIASNAAGLMNRYNDFWNSGNNCMIGIINGFSYYAQELYNRAYNTGADMVQSFNNGAGVNSPSVYFAESAMYCILGAVNGYQQYGYLLDQAAEEAGTSSVEVMKNVLGSMNFDDLDSAPVIRPVLDLTNIQNGASDIDRLLSTEDLGLDAVEAARLANSVEQMNAADMFLNNTYDDSQILAIVGDLGGRIDSLREAIYNMKIGIDGKGLVGQIMPEINSAMRSYEGRANRGVR